VVGETFRIPIFGITGYILEEFPVSECIFLMFISIICHWFSKGDIWPPGSHTKFIRGHRRMIKFRGHQKLSNESQKHNFMNIVLNLKLNQRFPSPHA